MGRHPQRGDRARVDGRQRRAPWPRSAACRDYGFVTVPYPHIPLAVWTDDEIDEVARDLAPQLLARLTEGDATCLTRRS